MLPRSASMLFAWLLCTVGTSGAITCQAESVDSKIAAYISKACASIVRSKIAIIPEPYKGLVKNSNIVFHGNGRQMDITYFVDRANILPFVGRSMGGGTTLKATSIMAFAGVLNQFEHDLLNNVNMAKDQRIQQMSNYKKYVFLQDKNGYIVFDLDLMDTFGPIEYHDYANHSAAIGHASYYFIDLERLVEVNLKGQQVITPAGMAAQLLKLPLK